MCRVGQRVETAEGMARQDVRSLNMPTLQQGVQVGRDLRPVLGGVSRLAPTPTGTVVGADPGVTGHGRGDPAHVRGHLASPRLEHDGRTSGARTAQVQAVAVHVDQLPRGRIGLGIDRLTDGLVAAPHRDEQQGGDHGVEQPAAPAGELATGAGDHPERQDEQGGRPHPGEDTAHRTAEHHEQQTTQTHECRRHQGPSLRLVGEANRQHGQQHLAHRETAQDGAGDAVFGGRDERGDDQQRRADQPGHQRTDNDPPDLAPTAVRRGGSHQSGAVGRRQGRRVVRWRCPSRQ